MNTPPTLHLGTTSRTTPTYQRRSHIYRRLLPEEVELELPIRPFSLVYLDQDTQLPNYVDHTRQYTLDALQRVAAEGRLYLVHATRWEGVESY